MRTAEATAKRPTNLSLNAVTLERAKGMGMNISQTVDELLAAEVAKRYWAQWSEKNALAITQYNARIARDGLTLSKHRTWGKSLDGEGAAQNG